MTSPHADETGSIAEFLIDGHRWFGLEFVPVMVCGRLQVASISIDLAAEGLLLPHQLAHDPDPVSGVALCRRPGGRLDYYTWGDCEPNMLPGLRPVVWVLGQAAVAAGAVAAAEWSALVEEDEIQG